MPAGICLLDSELRILEVNEWLASLAGSTTGGLVGRPLDDLLSGPSRILFQTHVYPALKASGRVEEVLLTLSARDGETVPVLLNVIRLGDGEDLRYSAAVVRIRARARWEKELLSAADELSVRFADEQRTRQFRDAFIGVIGHELRTPITTIYGMSQRLGSRYDSLPGDVVREHLADIAFEADRLRRLTEDLLVLSRSEAGRLVVAQEPLAVGPIVRAAVEAEAARSPGHRLEVAIEPDLPTVGGEAQYVEQVVGNYLGNAVKYAGAEAAIVTRAAEQDGGVAVTVSDTGPGLRGQAPDQLFELFFRAPGSDRVASGAGIGLFVCRTLVEAMKGRVWAREREAAPGSEFGFWLPALDAPPGAGPR